MYTITSYIDVSARQLAESHRQTLSRVQRELDKVMAKIRRAEQDGTKMSRAWLYQEARLRELETTIREEMTRFGSSAEQIAYQLQQRAVHLGATEAQTQIGRELPALRPQLVRQPMTAVRELIGRAGNGQPLGKLFAGFGEAAARDARNALISGVALGRGPREVGRAVSQALNVPLWRGQIIARQEAMRAYRDSEMAIFQANKDVLSGWVWIAALGAACICCTDMHGSIHPLDEDMVSHIACRCSMGPITRDYADILSGASSLAVDTSDMLDTSAFVPRGSDWFEQADADVQREILGPAKYGAWQSGDLQLSDLIGYRDNPEWGASMYEKSLKELGLDAQNYLPTISLNDVSFTPGAAERAGSEAAGLASSAAAPELTPEGYEILERTDDGLMLLKTPAGNIWTYEDATREEVTATLDELDPERYGKWSGIDQTMAELRGEGPDEIAFSVSRARDLYMRDATASYDLTADDRAFVEDLKQQIGALDQTTMGYTDMLNIGGQLNDRIDGDLADFKQWADEANGIRERAPNLTDAERAWAMGNPDAIAAHGGVKWVDAIPRYQAEYQARVSAYLSEVRDMGGTIEINASAAGYDARVADIVKAIEDRIPADWIAASNDLGDLTTVKDLERTSDGWYKGTWTGQGQLAIRLTKDAHEIDAQSVALHEMMHRMEQAIPRIAQLEQEFYDARTTDDVLTMLTNGIKEQTKLDDWVDEYLGRAPISVGRPVYQLPNGTDLYTVQSYELLSVGSESALGGGRTYDLVALRQDREFMAFVLGLLASVDA